MSPLFRLPKGSPKNWKAAAFPALFALLASLLFLLPVPVSAQIPTEHFFHVEASSFQFTPGTLKVNPGDTVTLELAATDYVHGLSIDGYNLEVISDPGQTARLTFTANQPGTFRFRCPVACGPMHPFMLGKLVVGPNLLLYRGIGLGLLGILAGVWLANREAIT